MKSDGRGDDAVSVGDATVLRETDMAIQVDADHVGKVSDYAYTEELRRVHEEALNKRVAEITVDELFALLGVSHDRYYELNRARERYHEDIEKALARLDRAHHVMIDGDPITFKSVADLHKWSRSVMERYNEDPTMELLVVSARVVK